MGRPGGGGGGGHHSSGGGHSFSSHSGGGHSFGGSSHSRPSGGGGFSHTSHSRPSGGGGFGGGRPHGGFGDPHPHGGFGAPPHHHPPRHYYGGYYGGYTPVHIVHHSILSSICSFILVFLIMMFAITALSFSNSSSEPTSTINREKLESNNAYINDCVIDELGWCDNISSIETNLKTFWKETGIQPYILLKSYESDVSTTSEQEAWASEYYEENFSDRTDVFLYIYFAAEDADNVEGYNYYEMGAQCSAIMDSEAMEIFWNYLDKYWYSDLSMDKLLINTFNDTAETIMTVTTTGADVANSFFKLCIIVVLIVGVVIIMIVKRKHDREKAEETERILSTPLETIGDGKADDLTKKYDN